MFETMVSFSSGAFGDCYLCFSLVGFMSNGSRSCLTSWF